MKQDTAADGDAKDAVDVKQIEQMGQEVVAAMRSLRELLDARATALEACRQALAEHYERFGKEREAFASEQAGLCESVERREAELAKQRAESNRLRKEAAKLTAANDERLEKLRRRDEESQSRLREVGAQEAALAQREASLEHARQEVEGQQATLEEERSALDGLKRELTDASARLERDKGEYQVQERQHADLKEELDRSRKQLAEQQRTISAQLTSIAQERESLQAREAELEQLRRDLADRNRELDKQQGQLAALQEEWDGKLRELNAASASLAALQEQLDGELTSLTNQTDELLPQYGVTGDLPHGASAEGGMPSAAEEAADKSVERFRKLCRDAKRRVIGA